MYTEFTCASDICKTANEWGFLPFFKGEIPEFSIEEFTPGDLWFSNTVEGPWEWKTECITDGALAYGKFYRGKACYVSMRFYPHLLNYRRATYTLTEQEQHVLNVLQDHRWLLSRDLKRLSGYTPRPRAPREQNPLLRAAARKSRAPLHDDRVEAFDTAVTRLQMAGRILISDFIYNIDRNGKRYGWSVARYCTPEDFFGADALAVNCTPEQSAQLLHDRLTSLLPQASVRQIDRIIG